MSNDRYVSPLSERYASKEMQLILILMWQKNGKR